MENSTDIAVQMNTTLMLDAASRGDLEEAERIGLLLPQFDFKPKHLFGPGFCIREITIPAGMLIIGHAHKQPIANMLVQGHVKLFNEGRWGDAHAPLFFVGKPGRKAAIAITETIWQNILVTEETDPSIIEELFIEHSEQWEECRKTREVI